jgi:hypothetical protein
MPLSAGLSLTATNKTSRGKAYGDKREYDHAIANYDQAIRLKPSYAAFNILPVGEADQHGSKLFYVRRCPVPGQSSHRRLIKADADVAD